MVLWQSWASCRACDTEEMFEVCDVGAGGGSEVLTSALPVILEFQLSSLICKRGAVRLMGLGPYRGAASI